MDLKGFLNLWEKMTKTQSLPNGVVLAGPPSVIQGEGRESLLLQMMGYSPLHQMSDNYFRLESESGRSVPVDDIRHMQHIISLRRGGQSPFFVIVPCAKAISTAGWNMMLKVLEEPPPRVHFIVFTPQHRHIPITVRSRMMPFFIYESDGMSAEDSLSVPETRLDGAALDRFLQGKPTQVEDWQRWMLGLRNTYRRCVDKGAWSDVTRLSGAFIEISEVLGQKRRDGSVNLKYRISEIVAKYSQ